MLVSVVTPSFQQGSFIERTLESVRRQSHAPIEHIVMDGGSTDGTVEILRRWSDRVTFSSGADGGQTAAINAGLARSRGEIVAYLNSDDVYLDGAVAAAVAAFEADPAADVVYGEAEYIDADDRVTGPYPTEEWSPERLKLICFLCQPAVFLRRRVLERFGGFDERLRYCMDYEYWLRLAAGGARFVHVPIKLAGSRLHASSKTVARTRDAHAEVNGMLRHLLGSVPDNWLSNYAYATLDGKGVPRGTSRRYAARIALRTIAAALRWNGVPSLSLLRSIASSLVHPPAMSRRIADA